MERQICETATAFAELSRRWCEASLWQAGCHLTTQKPAQGTGCRKCFWLVFQSTTKGHAKERAKLREEEQAKVHVEARARVHAEGQVRLHEASS